MSASRSLLLKALPFIAALTLVVAPVSAHSKHGHKKRTHHHEHRHTRCSQYAPTPIAWGWRGPEVRPLHRSFVVPTVIAAGDVPRLREWGHGYVYDAGHRHHHAVYAFPVLDQGVWVARPHAYCDGHLLSGHVAHAAPGFSFELGFGF